MSRFTTLFGILLLYGLASSAMAAVLEDFEFSDVNGTLLAAAANSVNPLNLWNEDTTDMDNSSVQDGVFRIQKSSAIGTPNGFGTNYLDIANVSSGRVWLVAEIGGWFFASGTTDPADFDPTQLEEIRFDFLENDGNSQGGSTVTAEVEIQREANGGIEILGTALGSGSDVGSQPLPLSQTDAFTVVLGLNKNANTYDIYTKSGAAGHSTCWGPVMSIRTETGIPSASWPTTALPEPASSST